MARYRDQEINRIIDEYQARYGKFASETVDLITKYIDDGMAIEDAVKKALSTSGFFTKNQDATIDAVIQAPAYGYGVSSPKDPAALRTILLTKSWAPDKMNLSKRLHGVQTDIRQTIVDTISTSMRLGKSWEQMARALYDGYGSGAVIKPTELPDYMQRLVAHSRRVLAGDKKALSWYKSAVDNAQRQISKLGANGSPNKALKAAYTELFNATLDLKQKAIERSIKVAVEEKSRYLAERIARTEISAAWGDGFLAKHKEDPDVIAFKWVLNPRHPKYDICDLYASVNLYGLGPGVYPKNKYPRRPAHPHCFCPIKQVYVGELHDDPDQEQRMLKNAKLNPKAMDDFLGSLPREKQLQVLGDDGLKAWQDGKEWQAVLRQWEDISSPTSRVVAADFGRTLSTDDKDGIMRQMREFKAIGNMPTNVATVLSDNYSVSNSTITISNETVKKITTDHPEFEGMDIPAFVNDIVKNASIVQANSRDDTVRIISVNQDLSSPLESMSEDKFFYLIMRLSNRHPVNFVKSLYPRNKIKGGEILWQKQKE